ncbi:MAG: SPASM domain-containing protein, partial [Acidimicrobiia bacterium]
REHVPTLLRDLASAGMASPIVRLDIHGIYAWSNDVSAVRLDRRQYAAQEIEWLNELLELGMDHQILPRRTAGKICPAVSQSDEVVSATGSVFSCTEHPLVDVHEGRDEVANIVDLPAPKLRPRGQFDDWHDRIDNGELPCSECNLLPVCGGSCPKHWTENDPPCPPAKINLQQRLDIVAHLNGLEVIKASGRKAHA